MMTIKVNFKDDSTITRINGTAKEIAEHYFSQSGVESIDILSGGSFTDEFVRRTPLKIYRVTDEEMRRFDLFNNIRYSFRVEYLKGQAENEVTSCGLCRV